MRRHVAVNKVWKRVSVMADRKFADWDWTDGNVNVTVEVRYRVGSDGWRLNNIDTSPPTFYVKTATVNAESGDLTVLAAMVREQLATHHALTWEQVIVVDVTTYDGDRRVGTYFEVEEWERAESKDGPRWRRRGSAAKRSGQHTQRAQPSGRILTDTPESRRKIMECETALANANEQIKHTLGRFVAPSETA
jgi:hypothetical protein